MPNNTLRVLKLHLPVVLWVVLIFAVSSLPRLPDINRPELSFDKIAHFFEYGILGFLLVRAIYRSYTSLDLIHAQIVTFGVALFVSAADEFHQLYVPNRTASFADFVADVAGITVSLLLFYLYVKKRPQAE